ncbi:MAG: hypothetical protein A2Z31_07800 [candidate division NC10 bacterium RBG_16_65_8]|nr:MAG: hypothetical protein A2Z31_07800 [candidate division NC10 bacterium RBG_16_65_8]
MGAASFQPFGFDHKTVLAFAVAAALALVTGVRAIRRIRDDRPIRYTATVVLALIGGVAWVRNYLEGLILFPFHLCDVALVAMVWALIWPTHRLVSELAFFWGLTGNVQAVLTPDLAQAFPSFRWISFFLLHCGVMLSAVYLAVRGHLVLRPASIRRAWFATNAYAAVAGFLNWQLGANFGFLARKPVNPSILDYLGPWPYYILACEGIALALFALCYGFARVVEHRAQGDARDKSAR